MANVLIIDDSLTVRMDLKDAFEAAGYAPTLCASLREAREALAQGLFGLIVLDVLLPNGDGIEFLGELRSNPRTASVAVMLLSSETEVRDRMRGLSKAADDYIGKPYNRSQIIERANRLLARRDTLASPGVAELAGRRVLAVDDSPTYLYGLAERLREDGIDVVTASCGEKAIDLLAGQAVDCILLDLLMPGLSGEETCRRIKASPAWRGIPVLMLTGLEDSRAMIASFNAGADDFISKSGDFSVLRARLRVQMRRKVFEEENRRIREQLQKKEVEAKAAELASQAKDHFLAVLSHELRTPLTPVLATASMLESAPELDEDVRQAIEVIRRNVELEARLIDDLLDVTRISRGKVELDRRPVKLCTVIQHAIEVCQPDIDARGLHFGLDLGTSAPYWVDADSARLQQVFWNLLKNAIKFTPQGGCVGIQVNAERRVLSAASNPASALSTQHSELGEQPYVIAEVSDSGAGIEPEAIDRIFNAFEQAERSITRQYGGLGLGLAISKALVEMHGGAISAHSQGKGKGATFRVRLPLLPRPAGQVAKPEKAQPGRLLGENGTPGIRILLVEDHGDTARIMKRLLEASSHEVRTAGDVATALDLAASQHFDLLISDLGLPDGSGVDLMRELRRRKLPIPGIALSGYGREDDVQQSRDAGFAEHLTKPVDLQRLGTTIARVVSARPAT